MEIAPEEEFLIARCVRKDSASLERLLQTHGRAVAAFIRMALPMPPEEEVKKILARSFAAALKSARPFEENEPFLIEALGYVLDEINRFRANSSTKERIRKEDVFANRLLLIRKGLDSLTQQERFLILLRDQMDLSHTELARLVPGSPHFLKQKIAEARVKFHQALTRLLDEKEKEYERLP